MGDDVNKVTVWVRQLQSVDGTAVDDRDDVEMKVKKGTDIADVKRAFFPKYDPTRLSKIQFYTPLCAGGANWEKISARDKLENEDDGRTFGYFPDADEQQPQEIGLNLRHQEQRQEQLNRIYAYITNKEADEATLEISNPGVTKYNRAVQKVGARLDAPDWKQKPTGLEE